MKKITHLFLSGFVILALFLGSTLRVYGSPGFSSGEEAFDVALFEKKIVEGLGTEWVGYQYVINEKGRMKYHGTFGNRLTGADGDVPQDIYAPMVIGSVSKFIAAVAVLKVFEEKFGDPMTMLETPVAGFLPKSWKRGFNVDRLTFKQLLQHKSGIRGSASPAYLSLKYLMEGGVATNKAPVYANANFALMRVLLPIMTGVVENTLESTQDDNLMRSKTADAFLDYLQKNLFVPYGILADARVFGIDPARYYRYPVDAESQGDNLEKDPLKERLGGGGMVMSSIALANFLAVLNHTDNILSPPTRQLLYENFLGLDGPQIRRRHGYYYHKGGSYSNARAYIFVFPATQTEVVILSNSRGGKLPEHSSVRSMVFSVYDRSWVKPGETS